MKPRKKVFADQFHIILKHGDIKGRAVNRDGFSFGRKSRSSHRFFLRDTVNDFVFSFGIKRYIQKCLYSTTP